MVRRKRTSRKTYRKIIFLFAINIVVCKDFYTFVKPAYKKLMKNRQHFLKFLQSYDMK